MHILNQDETLKPFDTNQESKQGNEKMKKEEQKTSINTDKTNTDKTSFFEQGKNVNFSEKE